MSPHPSLHPRSRLTTSLFGTTLLVSFLVVGMPHILPCPRPRIVYSDTELPYDPESPQRRRRRKPSDAIKNDHGSDIHGAGSTKEVGNVSADQEKADLDTRICGNHAKTLLRQAEQEREMARQREEMRRRGHECPVPKPGGWVGKVLGFGGGRGDEGDGGEG